MTWLEQSILKTLVWFDLFDFPLTSREIQQYLWKHSVDLANVEHTLSTSEALKKHIESREAFYYLKGRVDTVRTRKTRYTYAERKFKRAIRVCRLFTYLPWIKMIAVCNTLGLSNAADDSDIDLFIVTTQGRIWLTRFFVVGPLRVLGLRPILNRFSSLPENRRDKIDASFYITDHDYNLQSVALEDEDIYLAYWIHSLVPIYNKDYTYEGLLEYNSWTRAYIPNTIPYVPAYRRRLSLPPQWIHKLISFVFGDWAERTAERIEMRIMPEKLKELGGNGESAVVISENMLKFHDQDRRENYKEKWLNRVHSLYPNE